MAYMAGFVTFVLSLRKSSLKGQFKQLAYSHMAIIFAVFQSSLFVYNIFEGLIWLILPAYVALPD
jgi:phosphatidate cytidylyltransferase